MTTNILTLRNGVIIVENSKNKGGFFEQTQGKINPVVVKYYYAPRMAKSDGSFDYLVTVMEAHVIMLGEQGIIPREAASKLLRVMEGWGNTQPELDPSLEDLYINLEHLISKEAGEDICSYLPAARSRNDVEAAMWRMELRDRLFILAQALLDMSSVLRRRAEETIDWIFPGYTYHQQAMPVTMGFHLLGLSAPLLRDVKRIVECVDRFNLNPLGAAAMSGTEYPISRERTGELLGFDGVWEHTADAVSSADYMLEASNIAVMSLNTLARLAEDIIFWCTNEAGFADLSDDLIDSSSIMPQKRNPVICATVRSQARLVAGRYAGICDACSVQFQASRDMTAAWEDVLECVRTAEGMCRISEEYTRSLRFNQKRMEGVLARNFSNATELADSLVRQGGLSFRQAHRVVGGAVSELFERGLGQDSLTWELLDAYCRDINGMGLPLTPEQVEQAKDFRICVERRNCRGATAPGETARMLQLQQKDADALSELLCQRQTKWKQSNSKLHMRAKELALEA